MVGVEHASAVPVFIRVAAIAASLLVTHYAIQGLRLRARSAARGREFLHDLKLPGMAAEASLTPIGAVVLVLLYDPAQPLGWLLLSFTYLLINCVYSAARAQRAPASSRSGCTISRS